MNELEDKNTIKPGGRQPQAFKFSNQFDFPNPNTEHLLSPQDGNDNNITSVTQDEKTPINNQNSII